jgi:hypothetical protein
MVGEMLFQSSASVVYLVGGTVLISSGSISASIDSVSRSVSESSGISKKDTLPPEYGTPPSRSDSEPKEKAEWSDWEARYVEDVSHIATIHWEEGSTSTELSDTIQRLGKEMGIISNDSIGLSMVGMGIALRQVGISDSELYDILGNLQVTNFYGKNCILYGYRLASI